MKRLSFPLIVALSMATGAQADGERGGKQDRGGDSGQYVDQGKRESSAGVQIQGDVVSAKAALYRASAEYKAAWKAPAKPILLTKLYAYYETALAVHHLESATANPNARAHAGQNIRAYFDNEMERIEEYFDDQAKIAGLEERLYGLLSEMRVIDNTKSTDSMHKSLHKDYEKAEKVVEKLGELTKDGEYKKLLLATYRDVRQAIDNIDRIRKIDAKKHEKGVEKVAGRGQAEIDTHGTCKIVMNQDGRRLFVSTHTKDEWSGHENSFLNNLPDGVTANDCPRPRDDDDGDDHRNYQERGYKFGGGEKSWKDSQRDERESIGR